ncbi:hypothetical protein [Hansschlegelia zhihuaiae]|uniref:Uncharacterized protein n=1 Tax=Hansschlegelia zhihuaiae TaxID=405005 RepID=A0A4Q0M5D7_9HYPH|nr:hypothetical protein [Hansschlegelia zhihuaiae]RXF68228.1 hypothetical protein EK403_20200 [Hansschlegelia zhihuaiae]
MPAGSHRGDRGKARARALSLGAIQGLKVKCTTVGRFAVTAYMPGSRSLDIAEIKDGDVVPVGSVGSGLTEAAGRAIRAQIAAEGLAYVEASIGDGRRTGSCGIRR